MANHYADPRLIEYTLRWQNGFCSAKARYDPYTMLCAWHYVTELRIMRRQLRAGLEPSVRRFRSFRDSPLAAFLSKRGAKLVREAVRRGDSTRTMERRGLFDTLRHHQAFRGFVIKDHQGTPRRRRRRVNRV